MAVAEIKLKKWSRAEWHRLIELGVLAQDDAFELLAGEIVEMTPQSPLRAGATGIAFERLRRAFGEGYLIRVNMPVALDDQSEPEPDIAVVRGESRDFLLDHPSNPVLIVEVALSSLRKDRDRKCSLYARAGRQEYWILNLEGATLEVYRDPVMDGKGYYEGWSYATVIMLKKGDTVAPLALPDQEIAVADLLP